MKKKLITLALAAGLVWGCVTEAKAIEFKASGEWLMGFGAVENSFEQNHNGGNDVFGAAQRVRLQLDAIANEYLSATVQFEMGDTVWGNAESGGALGADGVIIEVMSAYLDWYVPNTELQFRMGLFGAAMPNAAGGSAVFDEQVAGIVANYAINDTASITAMWLRPFNDNYENLGRAFDDVDDPDNYLDNADYFGLALPLSFEGFEITPWALYGAIGRNVSISPDDDLNGELHSVFLPIGFNADTWRDGNAYGSQFFAGIPIVISAWDPFNIEFDINYGATYGFGEYNATNFHDGLTRHGASANRAGWVVKALVEYQMDWGRPGLFAWYASGDDGDIKNGSERMPTITGTGNFTSYVQDGYGWGALGESGLKVTYDGTWGIGLQVADFSFTEDLSHTIRLTYFGGTNSPEMMEYFDGSGGDNGWSSMYLTTQDHLVEINFDSVWSIYENLNAIFEIGYIFNGFNADEWNDTAGTTPNWAGKSDAWKVNLIMEYSF